MHIFCCVDVTIMEHATLRTRPCSDTQIKFVKHMTTNRAFFTGWFPPINLDQHSAIPLCLLSVFAALLFLCFSALCTCQLSLVFAEKLGVANFLVGRESDQ